MTAHLARPTRASVRTSAGLDERLSTEQQELISHLDQSLTNYLDLVARAFILDPHAALLGSIDLARELGVPADEILDSREKIHSYFVD